MPVTSASPSQSSSSGRDAAKEDYLDRVRGEYATEPYATAMRKRRVGAEPLFAEARDWHGLRRSRLQRLAKISSASPLFAAGQNLKMTPVHPGWGRRPFSTEAVIIVMLTSRPMLATIA